jgi:hypothetical protein
VVSFTGSALCYGWCLRELLYEGGEKARDFLAPIVERGWGLVRAAGIMNAVNSLSDRNSNDT